MKEGGREGMGEGGSGREGEGGRKWESGSGREGEGGREWESEGEGGCGRVRGAVGVE